MPLWVRVAVVVLLRVGVAVGLWLAVAVIVWVRVRVGDDNKPHMITIVLFRLCSDFD